MAYYVYKIFPPRRLEYAGEFEAYREARNFTRTMRKALAPEDDYTVRMILAPSQEQAERLLTEPREARPLGEDA